MSSEFDKEFVNFNKWHSYHNDRFRRGMMDDKNTVKYIGDLCDQIVLLLAHACHDIRRLEGRSREYANVIEVGR